MLNWWPRLEPYHSPSARTEVRKRQYISTPSYVFMSQCSNIYQDPSEMSVPTCIYRFYAPEHHNINYDKCQYTYEEKYHNTKSQSDFAGLSERRCIPVTL
jgi:hypothetical protein